MWQCQQTLLPCVCCWKLSVLGLLESGNETKASCMMIRTGRWVVGSATLFIWVTKEMCVLLKAMCARVGRVWKWDWSFLYTVIRAGRWVVGSATLFIWVTKEMCVLLKAMCARVGRVWKWDWSFLYTVIRAGRWVVGSATLFIWVTKEINHNDHEWEI